MKVFYAQNGEKLIQFKCKWQKIAAVNKIVKKKQIKYFTANRFVFEWFAQQNNKTTTTNDVVFVLQATAVKFCLTKAKKLTIAKKPVASWKIGAMQ